MSKLDDVLISYGRYIGQAVKPDNYGDNAEYMGFTKAKEEIQALFFEIISKAYGGGDKETATNLYIFKDTLEELVDEL